ncbi:leucyl aminopeptidase [Caulobacter sp. KR2-114]|uniref:leucyl aminopeptidase n=1 Tax=Caulobacter sp. KR2-114 TaxID=3400912 RepID=UPI003BFFAA90
MKIDFVAADAPVGAAAAVAVVAFEDGQFSSAAEALDLQLGGVLRRAVAGSRFKGTLGQTLDLIAVQGLDAARLVLVGAGKKDAWGERNAELSAAHAFNAVKTSGCDSLVIRLGDVAAEAAAAAAFGVTLAAYRFDRYRTTEKPEKKPSVAKVLVAVEGPKPASKAFKPLSGLADSIILARDLVSEPANVLYPEEFARRVKKLTDLGLEVEILGEKEMKKLGMGSLLGVGQGSVRESQLAIIQWKGAKDASAQPVAFVGKGVCFDTGGISLKPADGMEEMITDMGGAAAVTGVMRALASRKAKVNAVGILGLVENMPDGNAQRPGDVVTSMSGQTIEVINTDAEGRLVLADAVWYCQQRFKPKFLIDLATLTGAIIVGLGKDYGGLYANDDTLADNLLAASKATDETLWRMPLPPAYEKQIDSNVADVKNTGGRPGGSITAALFIQRFVKDTVWAHLDIAGPVWKSSSTSPIAPNGATGFGVRLLDKLVADFYEG